jgi:alpha-beta hydrolase superfamily lysophospholipase
VTRFCLLPLALLILIGTAPQALQGGRNVSFNAPDGTTLTAVVYESSNRPAPGIVLVHMLGRSKDEWIPLASTLQQTGATVVAIDLRGHGGSSGDGSMLALMVADVLAGADWLAHRPGIRGDAIAVVGASLGANLAALAAARNPSITAIALISPSLDYRGVRLDAAAIKQLGTRPMWLGASTEDPLALRTVKELITSGGPREQRLSGAPAHGTHLLAADQELTRALVDWLRRTLIF